MMRRRLARFLPVFLLALAIQVLAPVGACWASALTASDPLAGAPLCSGIGGGHTPDSGGNVHMRDGSCALCAAATAFSPMAPQVAASATARHVFRVAWTAFRPEARAAKAASSAQARAPPILS